MFDLVFAVLIWGLVASHLIRGQFALYGQPPVKRSEEPGVFWRHTALAAGLAAYATFHAWLALS